MTPDERWMQACLALARQGRTAPNPQVGALIVRDGQVLGEGFHPRAGEPHAEIWALRDAIARGHDVRGATLYVNLEPCNHFGRTPPCTEAILQAGLAKVVVGMVDPDPRVQGQGIARLRQGGLTVVVGVCETACQDLNEGFCHRIRTGRPFGIWKTALTLDGFVATDTGHSFWITSPQARQRVWHLRANCDAVITGGGTVRQDNPTLTSHGVSPHQPLRVVMSRHLDLPANAHLWHTATAPTLVCTGTPHPFLDTLQAQGVEGVVLPDCTPPAVAELLARRGCNTVLWECGPGLATPALTAGLVQKVWAFVAPKILGSGRSPLHSLGLTHMERAPTLQRCRWETVGPDGLVIGYLPHPQ
ncbi:MAG: bifunctional diaminohydroxyphosphoribosylaminopyrimidine deaminase/5-amino-6-(5-phosphoribosylamino)uracil reductase RibD [Pseudanabaenaceae cyanobacterium]